MIVLVCSLLMVYGQVTAELSVTIDKIHVRMANKGSETEFSVTLPFDAAAEKQRDKWIGIGFNKSPEMNGANSIICKYYGGSSSIEHTKNEAYVPNLLNNDSPQLGITDFKLTVNESSLTCQFTRQNVDESNKSYFEIYSGYYFYLIGAYGSLTSVGDFTFKQYHGSNRFISPLLIYPSPPQTERKTSISTTTTPTSVESNQRTQSIAGIFNLSWTDYPDFTDFEFTTKTLGLQNIWTAFAFSHDINMGDDDVNMCKNYNNILSVEHFYNSPIKGSPSLMDRANPSLGFSNIKASMSNNQLICSFRRAKSVNFTNYFDVSQQFHILIASGSILSGNLLYHFVRQATNEQFQLLSPESSTTGSTTETTTLTTTETSPSVFTKVIESISTSYQSTSTEIDRNEPNIYLVKGEETPATTSVLPIHHQHTNISLSQILANSSIKSVIMDELVFSIKDFLYDILNYIEKRAARFVH